jgi:hypothetical protein
MKPPPQLKELSFAQCQRMETRDITLFFEVCGSVLEWFDVSFCRGVGSGFTRPASILASTTALFHLPKLKTILLDDCRDMKECWLEHLIMSSPVLEELSVRGCKTSLEVFSIMLGFGDEVLPSCLAPEHLRCFNMVSLDVSQTLVDEDFVTLAIEKMKHLKYLGIEGCRGVTRDRRRKIRDGPLGKERKESMYVCVENEFNKEQVDVDELIECDEGQGRRTKKRAQKCIINNPKL